jgi:hypothetical protein
MPCQPCLAPATTTSPTFMGNIPKAEAPTTRRERSAKTLMVVVGDLSLGN